MYINVSSDCIDYLEIASLRVVLAVFLTAKFAQLEEKTAPKR